MRKLMRSLLALALFLLIFVNIAKYAEGATINGNIYDFSLNKLNNVVVEINSEPKQIYVAKEGSYSFNLPNGDYTVIAYQKFGNEISAKAEEKLSVRSDGQFSFDLILFPVLESGIDNEIPQGVLVETGDTTNYLIYGIIGAVLIAMLILVVIVVIFKKNRVSQHSHKVHKKNSTKTKKRKESKNKKEAETKSEHKYDSSKEDSTKLYDTHQVILALQKHGGRATQKDIRKEIPLSEAKISLMIAELESKGKIEKIKKGRGNIIILK